MTDLQRNTLYRMHGAIKGYQGKNIELRKTVPGDGFITVHTSGGNFNFNDDEIDAFIADLREPYSMAELPMQPQGENLPEAAKNDNGAMLPGFTPSPENVELKALLMHAIRSVKDNPAAIAQGKAIFEGAHAMVAIQKQEIEAYKLTQRKR